MSLEVKHLTHTYSAGSAFQATAVHDVSLTIEDGEFVCIVGHTGSGKSTLVQHLNGLLKPPPYPAESRAGVPVPGISAV